MNSTTDITDDPRHAQLRAAFTHFNAHSEALNAAYRELRAQAAALSDALRQARDGRDRELQEKQRLAERLAGILEALPALVLIVGRDGRIHDANVGASEAFGVKLIGECWRDVASEAFGVAELDSGEWALGERWFAVTETALDDTARLIVLIDVTEARAARQRAEREQRLATLGEMAARLAHQIRTPLSAAMLWSARADDPRARDKVLARLRDIESMVADLLRFARGTTNHRTRVDVVGLVDEAIDDARALAPDDLRFEFRHDLPALHVFGDRSALVGALSNLIGNAVAHSPADGRVQLSLALTGGDRLTLDVADEGPGIPAALRDQIFEPFFTTRANGTGLGLAVVRTVANAHDGDVACLPAERGAKFALTLPLADPLPRVGGASSVFAISDVAPPATFGREVAHG